MERIPTARRVLLCCLFYFTGITTGEMDATVLASLGDVQYYLYHTEPGVTWFQALDQCSTDSRRLAVLDHPGKINLIDHNLKYSMTGAWLGARPNLNLAAWRLFNGRNIPRGQGYFEETTDYEGNCLSLTDKYEYGMRFCGNKLQQYVCEFPLQNKHCTNTTAAQGWICLVILSGGSDVSWFEARKLCQLEGGDLADNDVSVNPEQLRQLVPHLQGNAHIGGYRLPWWWANSAGTYLAQVLYYDWIPGEENYDNNSCLTVAPSGWSPHQCNDPAQYFICEGASVSTVMSISSTKDELAPGSHVPLGYVVGCTLGGVVMLAIIIILVVLFVRSRRQTSNNERLQKSTELDDLAARKDNTEVYAYVVRPHKQNPATSVPITSDENGKDVPHMDVDGMSNPYTDIDAPHAPYVDMVGPTAPNVENTAYMNMAGQNVPNMNANRETTPHMDGNWQSAPYEDVDGHRAPFTDVNGQSAPFTDVNGQRAPFTDVNVQSAPFTDVNGQRAPSTDVDGQGALFMNADGQNTPYEEVNGQSTPFTDVNGQRAPFINANGQSTPYEDVNGQSDPFMNVNGKCAPHAKLSRQSTPYEDVNLKIAPNMDVNGKL